MDGTFKIWLDNGRSLAHYNHNHDKLGRFARSNGSKIRGPLVGWKNEMKDLYEKGLAGKYESEMKDLADKGIVGKYKSDFKKKFLAIEEPNDPNNIKVSFDKNNSAKISSEKHRCKSLKGDATVFKSKIDGEIIMFGDSSTRTYKREIRSKGGVHIIKPEPTQIIFENIQNSSSGIDKSMLKQMDALAKTKETNKAIYAGRDYAGDDYRRVASDIVGSNRKLLNQDIYPTHVRFRNIDNKPVLTEVSYADKYDTFQGHSLDVEFDGNGKPIRASYNG